ncbi:SusC/RagA family TonB-linked outer membrane protein [Sinomicrobium weinanense]|uniref:TonB-dependent receptor n=1 Tax=Sinomicrobium weinanense TaxID=2842200 RepID=A0A926JUS8_9FLAO|nr:TonB-dependent receptor [Sinomicrobium weinanense]MBC9797749.1 TonB-dependent receptor [Sinomicrobium weinanense]MBU3125986.1 TonB-dependent receptor [Sinomicrobium weinanense]
MKHIPDLKNWFWDRAIPLFSLVLMLFFSSVTYGQDRKTIRGKVIDEDGVPMPGVTVVVKNTSNGTVTDFDGLYTILPEKADVILVFSHLGFIKQEVPVSGKGQVNITLKEDVSRLNEVVVIGYGQAKKRDLTGATGSVDVESVAKAPVGSFDDALAGRVAGVQVTSSQGRPGSGTSIKIRGTGSLTQSSSPLYVIDGFPVENFDPSTIAQSDIESMEILKGPSAVAIYGSRGGNGVVMITTKGGVAGKTEVSYDMFYGIENITKRVDVLSPYDFVDLQYEINAENADRKYGPLGLYRKEDGSSIKGIDWQEEVFNQTEVQSHSAMVSGGNEGTKYNLSFSNYKGEGLLENSGFERTYLKLKLDQKVYHNLKAGANISYTKTGITGAHTSTNILDPSVEGGSSNARFNLLKDIVQGRPTGGLFYTNEDLINMPEDPDTEEGAPISNPIVNSRTQVREDDKHTFSFNGYLEYSVLKNLDLRVMGGLRKVFRKRGSFDEKNSVFERRNGFTRGRIIQQEATNLLLSTTLSYKKKVGKKHRFSGLLGFDYQDAEDYYTEASGSVFPEPNKGLDNLGAATEAGFPASSKSPTNKLISYFSRVNYTYDDRYLFTATIRRDGSSRFGKNKKFGLFPSLSGAWRFSEESFLVDSNLLSDGKLRVEWGQVGNNRIPAFVSSALLSSTTYGLENGIAAGVRPANLANPDIQWETQQQVDIGLDVGLFNNRVLFTADLYRKDSKDLLLRAPTPATVGVSSVYRNIGKIRNEGLELALSTVNIDKELRWTSDLNISFPKSKTLGLVENDTLYSNSSWYSNNISQDPYANDFITVVGKPFGQMYGFIDDGIYRADDFDETGVPYVDVAFGEAKPGHRKYEDINGDGVINDEDKVIIGNPNPVFFGGFNNTFSYKRFDLSVFLQWSYGNDVYNANRMLWTSNLKSVRNFIPEIVNRWRADHTEEQNKAATFRTIDDNTQVLTSQYIEDGSYLRLKTVSLGYRFPDKWLDRMFVQRLRIYVTAQNLVTWTSYTGYDPEVSTRGNGLTSGVDFGAYPRSRTFVGGISVAF